MRGASLAPSSELQSPAEWEEKEQEFLMFLFAMEFFKLILIGCQSVSKGIPQWALSLCLCLRLKTQTVQSGLTAPGCPVVQTGLIIIGTVQLLFLSAAGALHIPAVFNTVGWVYWNSVRHKSEEKKRRVGVKSGVGKKKTLLSSGWRRSAGNRERIQGGKLLKTARKVSLVVAVSSQREQEKVKKWVDESLDC